VWASNQQSGTVSRLNPKKRKVVKTIRVAGSPTCIRAGAGAIWVGSQSTDDVFRIAGTVTRIDPATGAIVATTKVGARPSDGTRGPDGLEWIPNLGDGTITRIDPATDKVVDTIPVVAGPFVARSFFGSVWVGDFRGTQVWRLTP
jgi:YVTN family beta-propeller protein